MLFHSVCLIIRSIQIKGPNGLGTIEDLGFAKNLLSERFLKEPLVFVSS